MIAGKLRHKITIEQPIRTRTPSGAFEDQWVPLLEDIWAEIEPLGGREIFTASQVAAEATTRIRIRYRAGLTAKMRVKVRSNLAGSPTQVEYYDIEGPPTEVLTRRKELILDCKKRDAQGFRTGGPS